MIVLNIDAIHFLNLVNILLKCGEISCIDMQRKHSVRGFLEIQVENI
jgi:hypothetical protein